MGISEIDAKGKTFLIVSLLYVVYTTFPLLADLIAIPVWAPSLISSTIFLFLYSSSFKNRMFYWFLVYAFVLFLYVLIGKPLTIGIGTVEDEKKILIELAYILPSISIASILKDIEDDRVTSVFIISSLIILFLSFIFAFPIILQYQSIRNALTDSVSSNGTMGVIGLPSYSLMHAYTLLVPAMCYWVKISTTIKEKLLSYVALVIICLMVYDTFVTTSLIILVCILLFSLFYKDSNNITYLFIFISFLFIILWKIGFFALIIDSIMPLFDGTPVESKLIDFKQSALGLDSENNTLEGRVDLHKISTDSFWENPIWGTSVVGGHSALLDRFGGMGILGGLPFIMLLISFMNIMKRMYLTKIARTFFYMVIMSSLVFIYEKGLWGCENWLMMMVLAPQFILFLEKRIWTKQCDN